MKVLLILIVLITWGCSDSTSDNYVDAKVHPVYYNALSGEWKPHEEVEIMRVHKIFSAGDIIEIRGKMYLVANTESKSDLLRDYQIELHMDTVWIYDGDRLVGSYISDWENQMDTFLIEDNR